MEIIQLKLNGLKLVKPKVFRDDRGFFFESFQQSTYEKNGIQGIYPQDNHSYSKKNCIRGMHFQSDPGQAKLIRVAVGKIYDVAVDIRIDSPTFGQWEAVELDDQNHYQLYVPVGFAHGFCVLSEEAHVMYKVSTPYNAKTEKGFRWDDPDIGIEWPVKRAVLSDRDQTAPFFKEIHSLLGVCE